MHMYLTGVWHRRTKYRPHNAKKNKKKTNKKNPSNNAKVNVLPDLDMIGGFGFSLTDENCGVMIGRRFSTKIKQIS